MPHHPLDGRRERVENQRAEHDRHEHVVHLLQHEDARDGREHEERDAADIDGHAQCGGGGFGVDSLKASGGRGRGDAVKAHGTTVHLHGAAASPIDPPPPPPIRCAG